MHCPPAAGPAGTMMLVASSAGVLMPAASLLKTQQDVEKLITWAYRDELSKRFTSSAEGIWENIRDFVVDAGRGSPQRYDFGMPDPDAEDIEKAVSALPDVIIDWEASREAVMGELAPLLVTRDVLLVRPFKTAALVTMHAIMGTRPDWHEDVPRPQFVPSAKNETRPSIVGECKGRNLYSAGSYCPLKWEPSPLSIALARLEYAVWHRGLCTLAETLELSRHAPLPPSASAQPWDETRAPQRIFIVGECKRSDQLPLKPQRDTMGPTKRTKRASAVRHIPLDTGAKA